MKVISIHTDGGCSGNPGPGGWAAVLKYNQHTMEVTGGAPETTNNRMELQAAIGALKVLREPCQIKFYLDSEYVRNGITQWMKGWKRNGWKTKAREPVKNEDLWRELDAATATHKIEWHWTKGHAGDPLNERCDQLATLEIEKIKKSRNRSA